MSDTTPTLKIRVELPDTGAHLGRDCKAVAQGLITAPGYEVVDAKWGRTYDQWVSDGQGWGRTRLNDKERGYVEAVRDIAAEHVVISSLLDIIARLSK